MHVTQIPKFQLVSDSLNVVELAAVVEKILVVFISIFLFVFLMITVM